MNRSKLFGPVRYQPKAETVLSHAALGALIGLGATWVMSQVSGAMYEREDPQTRRREDEVRGGGSPYENMAGRMADTMMKRPLAESERARYGEAVHYALGAGAGAVYGAIHAATPRAGVLRGLLFGLGWFLLVDEGLNPALGLTPGPRAFPWQAHARGLAAHLVFGLTTEAGMRALERPVLGAVGLPHHVSPRHSAWV